MTAAFQHISKVLLLSFIQVSEMFVHHQFGKSDNMIQRCSEFVAHIG